ncbi:MAG TPA: GWxTD domain-containing protein [Candidatus Acidoferrum sp.]|nr:GWxTD domain-containing protein [Candidatus Acidoferrum sp.]
MSRFVKAFAFVLVGLAFSGPATPGVPKQDQQKNAQSQTTPQSPQSTRKATKEEKKREASLLKELGEADRKWLDEDVPYIITPEERSAFIHLSTNEERDQFIEAFWARRNRDPDSPENTFKEEHYRRIAYANERFSSGVPGWKTDRGKIYIIWGAPDEIDSHPSGGAYERPPAEGGGETTTYPFEEWRYRHLDGVGDDITIEFVDTTMTGEYHITMDPSEKDALLEVPGAGLTIPEMMGTSSKTARFQNTNGTHLGQPLGGTPEAYDEFTRLEQYVKVQQPPAVKFKDLLGYSTEHLVRDELKFDYRFDFLRVTSDTVLVPITVQIPTRQLTFVEKDGIDSATLNLFARITTVSERTVQTFEQALNDSFPVSLLQPSLATFQIYQKEVPLSPGLYRLDIVVKDTASGKVGVASTALRVPAFQDDRLAASSLVLADDIHRVSSKDIGLGQFVLGDLKVRPKMDAAFTPNDAMGVFLQVYNLKIDGATKKADASVEFRIYKDKSTDPVLKIGVPAGKLPQQGEELTLADRIELASLAPGKYRLQVAVTDNVAKQTITPEANFNIKAQP